MRPFVAVVALSFWSHQAASQTLDDAIDSYDSGEFVAALDGFLVSATNGEAAAQYYLGRMYHHGDGVLRNVGMAVRWYRLAASGGHFLARLQLGHMFKTGEGVPQDGDEAAKWYALAAEQGQEEAEDWITLAIEIGAAETGLLPDADSDPTQITLTDPATEPGHNETGLEETHGREQELAQALAVVHGEFERLSLLIRQSREAQQQAGETLATRELELQDAEERIDRLRAALSALGDRTRELETALAIQEERTLLAQMQAPDNSPRIDELTRRLGIVEDERDEAIERSNLQARKISDLSNRLEALNTALEAAELETIQDFLLITELSEELNAAITAFFSELVRDCIDGDVSDLMQEARKQIGRIQRQRTREGERDLLNELYEKTVDLEDRLVSLNSSFAEAKIKDSKDLLGMFFVGIILDRCITG